MQPFPDIRGSFYRVDTRYLTFRECWYATRSPAVLILWLLKLLRIPLRQPGGIRHFESASELVIEGTDLPGPVREGIGQELVAFAALGFETPLLIHLVNSLETTQIYAATLPHPSGQAVARVLYVRSANVHPPIIKIVRAIITPLENGQFIATSGNRPDQSPPPWVKTTRFIGAPAARLWTEHQGALERVRSRGAVWSVRSREDLIAFCNEYDRRSFDHSIKRGLYKRMTEAEVAADQQRVTAAHALSTPSPAPPSPPMRPMPLLPGIEESNPELTLPIQVTDPETAAVIVAMEEQANPKSNWTATAWLLALSLIAFIAAGFTQFSVSSLAILVGVLFVHELGHYAAMRLFRYRNVRMFFLPFLGAAVSGSHFQVAGWKKAIVSLAGPVPGILLAFGVAYWNVGGDSPWREEVLWITLFLNAFNLLPFVPLDGGWFLNAVLFSRNPWFEAGFKVLGGLGLVALGVFANLGVALTVFGVLITLSVPASLRNAKIARRLRRSQLPVVSAGRTIPVETANVILGSLRPLAKTKLTLKQLAGHALDIFERMNARPPGWLASGALITVYLGSLAAAFFGASLVIAARQPDLMADAMPVDSPASTLAFRSGYVVLSKDLQTP